MEATTPSRDVLMGTEATISLPSELLEKQLEALERFQNLLVAVHTQYTTVLVDFMQATNGEIIHYLPIMPSVVEERTKDLLQMDFRSQGYTIFCGFEHTRRLITDAIKTTQRLLQGFYNVSEAVLAEKDKGVPWTRNYDARLLQKIMQSRQENQEQLAKVERDIAVLEGEVLLLKVEFDIMVNSYWNTKAADEPNRQEEYPPEDLRTKYLESIAEKQKFIIKVLRSQFDFSFAALDGIVKYTMRFNSNPRIATLFQQHPTRLPYELQERIRKLPDHLALSKPTLVITELTDAVKYVQSEYEKAFQIMVTYYRAGIESRMTDGQSIPRVQKTIDKANSVKQLGAWDRMHFEFRLAYAHAEIQRYLQEIERIGTGLGAKAQAEMKKEGEEALENLLLAMTEVERKKSDFICSLSVKRERLENAAEGSRGASNTDELNRKKAKNILDGAEPWKELDKWQEIGMKAFIKWQHENPEGGGTDGWMKSLGLENWEKKPPSKELQESVMKKLGIEM